jgi:hypothetical protein
MKSGNRSYEPPRVERRTALRDPLVGTFTSPPPTFSAAFRPAARTTRQLR